jgi:hypothetical protein
MSGTTYTYVSGTTINAGGAANMMGGGKPILVPTSTLAIVETGTAMSSAKSNVPVNNLFIF